MRAVIFVSAAMLMVGQVGNAIAACNPDPAPAPAPSVPNQAPVVTQATAQQSASATAGLIADRVATVVSGINAGGAVGGGTQPAERNTNCPQLTDSMPDALDRSLGVSASGKAAGNGPAGYNSVWAGGSYNHVKKGDTNGRYNGDVKNGVVGYDRRITKDLIVGLATGYEQVDISTEYNQGSVEGSSVSISPYVGYMINSWLSADATLGHTWIDYDFSRSSGSVTGSTTAGRWFGAANLNATHRMGSLQLRGGVGYLRLYEQQEAYRDSTGAQVDDAQVNFGQVRTTLGGSYDVVTGFGMLSPNAFVRLEYDTPSSHSVMVGNNWMSSTDRTGAVFGVGVDATIDNDLLVNLTLTSTQFRQNTEAYSVVGNVRYSF